MTGLRLLVHVEGQTEEAFVNDVLGPHLRARGYSSISARLLGNARSRARRGGIRSWQSARKDIIRHLREDRGCIATTMVDYYGLPASGQRAWPGRAADLPPSTTSSARAEAIEAALLEDVARDIGPDFDRDRFEPFVVMHEYEALLFSDSDKFADSVGKPDLAIRLAAIRNQFATPEDINDSEQTAPSKRILSVIEGYDKAFHGVLALDEIGLPTVRSECPHFDRWVRRLEERAGTAS